jgi:hypothetical protein
VVGEETTSTSTTIITSTVTQILAATVRRNCRLVVAIAEIWAVVADKATGSTVRNIAVGLPIETAPQRTGSAALRGEILSPIVRPELGSNSAARVAE